MINGCAGKSPVGGKSCLKNQSITVYGIAKVYNEWKSKYDTGTNNEKVVALICLWMSLNSVAIYKI